MRHRHPSRAVVALALLLAACGGGEDPAATSGSPPSATTADAASPDATAPAAPTADADDGGDGAAGRGASVLVDGEPQAYAFTGLTLQAAELGLLPSCGTAAMGAFRATGHLVDDAGTIRVDADGEPVGTLDLVLRAEPGAQTVTPRVGLVDTERGWDLRAEDGAGLDEVVVDGESAAGTVALVGADDGAPHTLELALDCDG